VFYSVGAGDNLFQSNEFNVRNTSAQSSAHAFYIGASHNGGIWKDNLIRSQVTPIWFANPYGAAANARLVANQFVRIANSSLPSADVLPAIRLGYCCGYESDDLVLRDNELDTGLEGLEFASNQPAPYSLKVQWTASLLVQDSSGAPARGATVILQGQTAKYEATTDQGGQARLVVTDYSQSGTNHRSATTAKRTDQNPYKLIVRSGAATVHTESLRIEAPLNKTIRVNL
jgi:hypothetical protein